MLYIIRWTGEQYFYIFYITSLHFVSYYYVQQLVWDAHLNIYLSNTSLDQYLHNSVLYSSQIKYIHKFDLGAYIC